MLTRELVAELPEESFTFAVSVCAPLERELVLREKDQLEVPEALAKAPPSTESWTEVIDRKSTRLNSSHGYISYAVFCLKKKKKSHPRVGVRAHQLARSAGARAADPDHALLRQHDPRRDRRTARHRHDACRQPAGAGAPL